MQVLVVEDEPRIASILKRGLEADGFRVDVALDGDDGLARATGGDYDVIVLDLMLPGRSGTEVCTALRSQGDWTPILVLTARDGTRDEAAALDSGADDFLRKPFAYPVLLSRLRALVRRSGREPDDVDPTLTVGDLRLDPVAQRAWRGNSELTLTPKAFTVLHVFMRRPGHVVSKRELLELAWGFDFDGDPDIVEAYVSRLRRVVDKPFDAESIVTVRGVGYRLDPRGQASQ